MTDATPTPEAGRAILFPAGTDADGSSQRPRWVHIEHVNDITEEHFPHGWHLLEGDGWTAITSETHDDRQPVNTEARVFLNRLHRDSGVQIRGPMLLTGPGWGIPALPAAIGELALNPYPSAARLTRDALADA